MAKKPTNPDYVEHGSDRHAAILGLVKASKDDEPQWQGWALADITICGSAARPEFLLQTLKQKVSELTTLPPVPQSEDPNLPGYAPPIWMPSGEPVSGYV